MPALLARMPFARDTANSRLDKGEAETLVLLGEIRPGRPRQPFHTHAAPPPMAPSSGAVFRIPPNCVQPGSVPCRFPRPAAAPASPTAQAAGRTCPSASAPRFTMASTAPFRGGECQAAERPRDPRSTIAVIARTEGGPRFQRKHRHERIRRSRSPIVPDRGRRLHAVLHPARIRARRPGTGTETRLPTSPKYTSCNNLHFTNGVVHPVPYSAPDSTTTWCWQCPDTPLIPRELHQCATSATARASRSSSS